MLVERELGETHAGIAFGPTNELFLGSESGVLSRLSRDAGGAWTLSRLWQGQSAIRWLEASPRGRFLALVDQANFAQQFNLREGRIGATSLQLPAPVEEVKYSPGGSRVLFRTARWIHRAISSTNGLVRTDTIFAPKALSGARMVFGDTENYNNVAGLYYVFTKSIESTP